MKIITQVRFVLTISLIGFFSSQSFSSGAPTALFSFSPSPVCLNVPITFTDNSTGTKIVSWKWTFGAGASIASDTTNTPPTVSYSTVGQKLVTLIVKDSLGRSATLSQVFSVDSAYSNPGVNATICSTSSAAIGASPVAGYTYNWIPSSGLTSSSIANPIANPSATTTYTLTTVAPNGCTATAQVVINNIGVLVANAGVTQTICAGNSTNIGTAAIAGYNYSWVPTLNLSSPTSAVTAASPTTTTTYQLTVSAAGCVATNNVVVNVNPSPALSANDTLNKCLASSISIGSTAIAGNSYSWAPSTNLSSANSSNPTSSTTISRLYKLTVTNAFNCMASKTTFVNVYSPLNAFAGLSQTVCNGNAIILGGSPDVATGGSGVYNYSWTPTATINNATIAHPSATPTITTKYYLTVTDQGGSACGIAYDSVLLTISPLPHPVISMPTEFCVNSPAITLNGTPSGGTFSGVGVIGNVYYPNSTSIVLGTPYPITYTYNSNGCVYDTAISVVVYGMPIADAGSNQIICSNLGQTFVALTATGGVNYSWSPSASLSNTTSSTTIASPTVTTKYFVDVTLNHCTSRDSVTVIVSNTCGVDSILIANDDYVAVPMNKTSRINYLGNDDLINGSPSLQAVIFTHTKHGVVAINTNNKMDYIPNTDYIGYDTLIYQLNDSVIALHPVKYLSDTALVFITITPDVVADNYLVHCDDSITVNPILNDQYGNGLYPITIAIVAAPKHGTAYWSSNLFHYQPNTSFVGLDTVSYSICVNNICAVGYIYIRVSCENKPIANNDYLTVGNNEILSTNQLSNDVYHNQMPLSVYIITPPSHGSASVSNNNISYIPSNGFVGVDSIQYSICNAVGCDTAWIVIKIFDNSPCQMPTGFSPNGDGVNETFHVNCADRYPNNHMVIFNRWGNEVFSRSNYNSNNEWDGTYKNANAPDGTYYYVFQINDGTQKPKTGFIEVKR